MVGRVPQSSGEVMVGRVPQSSGEMMVDQHRLVVMEVSDSGYVLKLDPARFADRLAIELRRRAELRLTSKYFP